MGNKQKINVSVLVRATAERAWDVFTRPEYIIQWNHASEDWCCPRARNDLRPGGSFSWRMESKDGAMGFDYEGRYDQVVEHKRIVLSLGDSRMVEIGFQPTQEGIMVTETFDAESENSVELQRAGWQAILDNYRAKAESKD